MKLSYDGESAAIYLNSVEKKGAGGPGWSVLDKDGRGGRPMNVGIKRGKQGREHFRREDDTKGERLDN